MFTRLRVFVLIAALLWQSLGMVGSAVAAQRAAELTHITVHTQSLDHHHHDDQVLYAGDDNALECGVPHMHADPGVTPLGILVCFQLAVVPTRSTSPLPVRQVDWLSHTLDGLLRPPKRLA